MVRASVRRSSAWWSDRLRLLGIALGIFAVLLVLRVFSLQVASHGFYAALAADQHEMTAQLQPTRGDILVRDRQAATGTYPLATNKTRYLLYAVPKQITNPSEVAKILAPLVGVNEETILSRLQKPDDLYEPIQHELSEAKRDEIAALKIEGLFFADENTRYYPEKNIGSHVLGFVGYDKDKKVGRYGLEGAHETALAGKQGYLQAEKDASGQLIATAAQLWQPAIDGVDIVLTIDRTIQFEACRSLNEAVLKHGADGGSLVILDPQTGAVLAMCGSPDYDPNTYSTVKDIKTFANPVTQVPYEPGSVFKPLTMAAALNEDALTPDTTYTDTGEIKVGSFTIRNSDKKSNGLQTMYEVLEKSLNTGAIFSMQSIGPSTFERYVQAYGFGAPTGIEISEATGTISSLSQGKDIYAMTGSFGQGLTVTPLQLAVAYGALANGGKLMQPYLIDSVIKADGTIVTTQPKKVRQVLTAKTSATIGAMLVRVVRNGHGKRAGVSGYFVAGKTGTAQIPDPTTGTYHDNETIGTFAGFAPVENPRFVMVAQLVRPRDVQFAESTAAPLFGDIAKFLLLYLGIPPTEDIVAKP